MGGFDQTSMAQAFSGPNDTRQWLAYGQVAPDTADTKSVYYQDPDGNDLPEGVLVVVKLSMTGISLPCRVLQRHAGSGEGAWSPIGPGDEVLVAIPEGQEAMGGVILGRLSNQYDVFPKNVAGTDMTQNNVVFDRHVCPYIHEVGTSWLTRSAQTNAQIAIDSTGNIFAASGDGHSLSLTASILSLQSADQQAFVQVDPSGHTVSLGAGGTTFLVDNSESFFQTAGTLALQTSGVGAGGHAVTLEQVLNLLINFVYLLSGPQGSSTLHTDLSAASKLLDPATFPTGWITALQLMLTNAVSPIPPTAVAGGGELDAFTLGVLVTAALSAQLPNPADLGLPAPLLPGIAKAGLKF